MRVFLYSIIRWVVFLAVIVATVTFTRDWLPFHDPSRIASTVTESVRTGSPELLSDKAFVFALAAALMMVAVGFLLAYLLVNIIPIIYLLWRARAQTVQVTKGAKTPVERRRLFAENFDGLRQKLQERPLVGHAFAEFCETLVGTDQAEIQNTVRPQAFFHAGLARDVMPGLKLMNAIPGYFVGIGLLLTFIGLVLALAKAGQAASAADAEKMQTAMTELLNIATFKFATSIAGLGASIALSFVFRLYSVAIEAAFERFCVVLESGLLYAAPQSISAEINATMKEQLKQLKDITQGDFFARMGEHIAPRMNEAIASAMAPVSQHIKDAVSDLKANSRTGMTDMLQEFGRTIQGSAGTEMQALTETLGQMEKTLASMQNDLRGSGEDFGRRMAEAAEQLKQFVEDAGRSFEQSSTESRDALAEVAATLKETLERANADVAVGLGAAAGNASSKLEEAMGKVMGKLDGQIAALGDGLSATQIAIERQVHAADAQQAAQRALLERTTEEAAVAQGRIQESLNTALEEMGAKLNHAVEQTVNLVRERFEALGRQMLAVETALGNQRSALEGTASEARKTADVFSTTAQEIRVATAPLVEVGDRFAAASESINGNLDRSVEALKQMHSEVAALAEAMQATNGQTQDFWKDFKDKFDQVDTALGRAVETLSRSTADQSQLLSSQVGAVDHALAEAIGKLNPLLADLTDAAGDIADSLGKGRPALVNGYHEAAR